MSGGSIYDLKKVLGHADVKTTERYAHLSADHLASVRDIIKPNIGSNAEVITMSEKKIFQHVLDQSSPQELAN